MKNKIILLSTLLAGLFILNSCLKDEADYWKDDVAGKMYATIITPRMQYQSLLPVASDVTISFMVNIASDALPTKDISVTFALDNAVISAYDSTLKASAVELNDTFPTGLLHGKPRWKDYKPFPSVVLLTPTIIIPAGSRTGIVSFKVSRADTIKLTDSENRLGNYMTAITMTACDIPIAANMKTIKYAFPLANEYEAEYLSEGFRNHPTNGIEPFKYAKILFTTVNGNTVHKDRCGNYGGYELDIIVTANTIVVNGVTCFKCNVALTPGSGGDPAAGGWGQTDTFEGDPMNYYNPVTKVFELYYYYNSGAPRRLRETNSRI